MRLATVGFVTAMLVLLTFPQASAQDDDPYARGYQQGIKLKILAALRQ